MMSLNRAQRGNILFLILLAVVLFAALSYAVTQSLRGGGKDSSSENARAAAADILSFFSQVDAAVLRMQMTGGLKPENISFIYLRRTYGNPVEVLAGVNNACSTDNCRVFATAGGDVAPRNFEKYAYLNPPSYQSNWVAPGYHFTRLFVWPQVGTSLNDYIMILPAIKKTICDEINTQMGTTYATVAGPDTASTADSSTWDNASMYVSSSNASSLADKSVFTVLSGGGLYCDIYHLVFPR